MTNEQTLRAGPQQPAVDLEHLNQYTGGDVAVNGEVLQLFQGQAADMLAQLEKSLAARDCAGWFDAAHTFKGGSRGIGAFALAETIAEAERLDPAAQRAEARASLNMIEAQCGQVLAFIESYLG